MFSAILWRPPFLRPERSAEGGLQRILNAPQKKIAQLGPKLIVKLLSCIIMDIFGVKKVGKIWVIFEMPKNQVKFRHFFIA